MQAGWLYGWQCRSFHHFGPNWNISTTGWIAMKLCTDMNGAQTMNPSDFGDTLTFRLALPWGCHFCFLRTCLHNYWMHCHWIWYRQLWRPNDESQWLWWSLAFSSNATITLLGEMSQILLDGMLWNLVQTFMFPSGWTVTSRWWPPVFSSSAIIISKLICPKLKFWPTNLQK